ncbi:MAG: glucan 1,4-alpha-glucosidase [Nitrososphaerota archaeon]|nr:glucan 1,4-alpha-glucosidase [Nitrososphaerota archaeon]
MGGPAPGGPGMEPKWTRGNKDGVGTAYSADSKLWYTLWSGIVTEVYFPTIDRPQLRDMQFLVTDGETFFHEEKRQLRHRVEKLAHHALGYRVTNADPKGRYEIVKEVIGDPHLPVLLQNTTLRRKGKGRTDDGNDIRLYALCAPHLEVGGWGNSAFSTDFSGRKVLVAQKQGTWMAMGASVPFTKTSCGYVGKSDGWTDISSDFKMDWNYESAEDGNIALTAEMPPVDTFTLALSFGETLHRSVTTLFQSLSTPFDAQKEKFLDQWERPTRHILPLEQHSRDSGSLYHTSYSVILAHEDKSYPGAVIASLSIPWGEVRGDEDQGGYHLVWTRDLVQAALGLLAAGDTETPWRALIYLAVSQHQNGSFPQNFWIDGTAYWSGVQLDEASFPIILAWRLAEANALKDFDPFVMVMRAAKFIVEFGPSTGQDRWEEVGGYSPSTLASNIAALCCAADFARRRGDGVSAGFFEEYSDFLECHLEAWTATAGPRRHFIRVQPADRDVDGPAHKMVTLANREPGSQATFEAEEIVDAGFLELVRFGIRRPDDPIIQSTVELVDRILKVDTPFGPCWHRYNNDGYGQREDGSAYRDGWGRGRAWPLLTAERGNYEFAAGRSVAAYIHAMEGFASEAGLLPEQVWDEKDAPDAHMWLGRPTGSAMPLVWAHAEYIKLLRSVHDGKPFDRIRCVFERYSSKRHSNVEVWKSNRNVRHAKKGSKLKIVAEEPFVLHLSFDGWKTVKDVNSIHLPAGIDFVDVPPEGANLVFTFYWPARGVWEGRDYSVGFS